MVVEVTNKSLATYEKLIQSFLDQVAGSDGVSSTWSLTGNESGRGSRLVMIIVEHEQEAFYRALNETRIKASIQH